MKHYEIGQLVLVKNNDAEPPRHHTKKWKSWNHYNFNGEIIEVNEKEGTVLVKDSDSSNVVIEMRHQFRLTNSSVSITPIENSIADIGCSND